MRDGMGQLQTTARDPGMILSPHFKRQIIGDLLPGFFKFTFLGKDQSCHDQGLGSGPAFNKPTVHQKLIEAYLGDGLYALTGELSSASRPSAVITVSTICWAFNRARSYCLAGLS